MTAMGWCCLGCSYRRCEVPEGCGLWTWTGKQLKTLVEPPALTPADPPVWWWTSLTRRLAELSAELAELRDFDNRAASGSDILSSVEVEKAELEG